MKRRRASFEKLVRELPEAQDVLTDMLILELVDYVRWAFGKIEQGTTAPDRALWFSRIDETQRRIIQISAMGADNWLESDLGRHSTVIETQQVAVVEQHRRGGFLAFLVRLKVRWC